MNPEELIQWLLDSKLAITRFDKFLNEQTIEISNFGIEINQILNKLKEDSKEAEYTNIFAAKKLQELEKE